MPVEYICDGCGKRQEGGFNYRGDSLKPHKWYSRVITYIPEGYRTEVKKTLYACSRECTSKLGGLHAPW